MRILVVSNLYPPDILGGYEVACAQAVEALIARGHDVRVLAARPREPVADAPYVTRELDLTDEWGDTALGWNPVTRPTKISRSRVVNSYNVHALLDTLGEFGPDVVYLHNLVGLGGLALVACLGHLGVPWVWHLGDYVPAELCSNSDGPVAGLGEAFGRAVSGSYIVVSQRVHVACSVGGLALNGRVELIPYWITGERPAPRASTFQRGGHLRVMTAGRVDRQKGVHIAIEAAARLRDEGYANFSVDVYGRVADASFAGDLIAQGLDGVVTLKGPRPHRELLDLYARYDLCLFTTRKIEPFGLVPLEAAARGCVPVLTDDCGIAEWLVHGVHGLKSPRKSGAFARAIRGVLDGKIDLGPLANRAAEAVWRDFHLDTVLPAIESQLADAAARPRPPAGDPSEAYRLARMAEHLSETLIQEALNV